MTININFTRSTNRRPRTLSAYQHVSTHRTSQRPNGSPWLGEARQDIQKGSLGSVALNADDDPADEVQALADWRVKELDVVAIWKPRNSDDYICSPWPKDCYQVSDLFGIPTTGISAVDNDRVAKFTYDGCTTEEIDDCPQVGTVVLNRYTVIGIDADDVALTTSPAECPFDSVTPTGEEFSIATGRVQYDGSVDLEFKFSVQAVTTGTGDATIDLIHVTGAATTYLQPDGIFTYFRPGGVDSYIRTIYTTKILTMQATGVDTTTKVVFFTMSPEDTVHLEAYENAGGYSMVVEMDQTEILIEP
jgi:hypothetical protein